MPCLRFVLLAEDAKQPSFFVLLFFATKEARNRYLDDDGYNDG